MLFWRQNRVLAVTFASLLLGIFFTALNVYELHRMQREHMSVAHPPAAPNVDNRPIYWLHANKPDGPSLRHVRAVFDRLGYVRGNKDSKWTVLWSHAYPFKVLKEELSSRKSSQKINHFPGSGFISNKVYLATSDLKYVPKAFSIPKEKDKLFEYVKEHPDKKFVQKSSNHRGIKIKNIDDLDLRSEGTFVQEFVDDPLLIDGHKFDIGVYTIITSVDPLRVYIYEGDYLLRFCPNKYYPFDPANLNKYVVKDDYLPIWKVPSLKGYYTDQGHTMKDSLSAHLKSIGKDPDTIYSQIRASIIEVTLSKEMSILSSVMKHPHNRAYFEMFRFDFVVDEHFNVYLMEANMSPNLSSVHFPENKLLYEQVIFNLLSLVGVGTRLYQDSLTPTDEDSWKMQVSDRDIAVFSEECSSRECQDGCSKPKCQLCRQCLRADFVSVLKEAYRENRDKHSCKRLIPPSTNSTPAVSTEGLTNNNKLLFLWYQGKCELDKSFC